MPSITKQFPGPSVDNPVLLGQFAGTLRERYAEMFPPRRGFTVEFEERSTKKSRSWEIRILHGKFGGTNISMRPSIVRPQEVWISVSATSRFERRLLKVAVWIAAVLAAPLFLAGALKAGSFGAMLVGAPIYFVVAFVLGMIAVSIGRLFARRDHHFDPNLRRRILALAKDTPLPTVLERPATPAPTSSPVSPITLEAQPKRTGPGIFG